MFTGPLALERVSSMSRSRMIGESAPPGSRPLSVFKLVCFLLVLLPVSVTASGESVRLLAFGNSLVAGFGLSTSDGFVVQLENTLRDRHFDVDVIDGGVSGDTTSGGLARIEWALADRIDAVILELGSNDALRGIDPAITRKNLDSILKILSDRNVPVLLAGMYAPRNLGVEYTESFDRIYPELAAIHDTVYYPFFLEGVAGKPALNQEDGIHPNAAGVEEIVQRLIPYVEMLLKRVESPP